MLVFYGGTGMAYIHLVPPIVGAWTANALFGIGGAILFIRTPT
jgi:lipopolysaccharide export LptBFGC system permease protein LptF